VVTPNNADGRRAEHAEVQGAGDGSAAKSGLEQFKGDGRDGVRPLPVQIARTRTSEGMVLEKDVGADVAESEYTLESVR
jgi:hypothetical protein